MLSNTPADQLPSAPLIDGSSINESVAAAAVLASSSLTCPEFSNGVDRVVPWTSVYLKKLPRRSVNSADTNTTHCGIWHVLMREKQQLQLPTGAGCGSPANESELFVLSGDGGWGLYWALHPAAHRAALRTWVAAELRELLLLDAATAVGDSFNTNNMQLLFTASKILKDQADLAMSLVSEVPGREAWEAVQAAAAGATTATGTSDAGLYGSAIYVLLMPLLPVIDVLADRLSTNTSCRQQLQVLMKVASRALLTVLCNMCEEQYP
jgi:hypothetical protein